MKYFVLLLLCLGVIGCGEQIYYEPTREFLNEGVVKEYNCGKNTCRAVILLSSGDFIHRTINDLVISGDKVCEIRFSCIKPYFHCHIKVDGFNYYSTGRYWRLCENSYDFL